MQILEFGQSPQAMEMGYSNLLETFDGTRYQAESEYEDKDVILVQGIAYEGDPDVFEFAVFQKPLPQTELASSRPTHCGMCSRELNIATDPLSRDCGGDCLQCVAESGDEDAIASLAAMKGSMYSLLSLNDIFEEAEKIRQAYAVNGYFNLDRCKELTGIRVSIVDLWNPKVSDATLLDVSDSGITIKHDPGLGPLRRNLTIAQALGFYFLQYVRPKNHGFDIKRFAINKFVTGDYFKQAHIFACALLMPADRFEAAYSKNEGNELALSDIFNVPASAVKQMHEFINIRNGIKHEE